MIQINGKYQRGLESHKRFLVLYGGAGSGKSIFAHQKLLLRCLQETNHRFLVIRKVARTLKESVYQDFKRVAMQAELNQFFKFTVSPLEVTCINGNKIIFMGIDDPEKLKSISGITGIFIEEASELDEKDFKQLNTRLRGKTDSYKQIMLSFNPIDESHWLKSVFFDNLNQKVDVIHSTYKDNQYLMKYDTDYVEELESYKHTDKYWYDVYCLGKWGKPIKEGRVYWKFDDANILDDVRYNPNYPIILCCDFNVNPMCWALMQNYDGKDIVFDEIVLQNTTTERACEEFKRRYPGIKPVVYGDYSGNSRTTKTTSTDYDIIRQMLTPSAVRLKGNPLEIDRINAVNWRFCDLRNERRLFVTRNCKTVIKDFREVAFDDKGRIDDKTNKTKDLSHISDAIGYYIEYEYSIKGKPTIRFKK